MKAYEEDPLIYHGRVMFSWVGAMRDGIESIQHQLSVIQLPVLFIHGKEDQTVPIGNSHFGFEQIGSEDRTFKVSSCTTYNYTTACIVMFGRATQITKVDFACIVHPESPCAEIASALDVRGPGTREFVQVAREWLCECA